MRLLELVGDLGREALELSDAFLAAGYGASYGKIEMTRRTREKEQSRALSHDQQTTHARRQYRNLLYRLKQGGFLQTERRGAVQRFILTRKGKAYLLRLKKNFALPHPNCYHQRKGDVFVIIAFDIPETERRKRDWLRSVLKHLGLKMIQRSVWVGKVKIPESFLKDLKELRLLPFVEIFTVTKTGNLRTL